MSTGNRIAGQSSDGAKVAPRPPASARMSVQAAPARMSTQGGQSGAAFIAIAVGVIAIAVAGAFFVSGRMDAASARDVVRPIGVLAAELDRDQLKTALVTQAFPDRAGKAFMAKVAAFPDAHDALLGQLADAAEAGADRNGLVRTLDDWTKDFAYAHYQAISRTGSMGFDRSMHLATAQLDIMSGKGGCTISAVRRLVDGPFDAVALADYGTPGYSLLMQANQARVDLALAGERMPFVESVMRVSDGKAVLAAFSSLTKDPQAMAILKTMIQNAGGDPVGKVKKARPKKRSAQPVKQLAPDEIDICALGKTIVGKMQGLPAETKARLWAASVSRSTTAYIVAHR